VTTEPIRGEGGEKDEMQDRAGTYLPDIWSGRARDE